MIILSVVGSRLYFGVGVKCFAYEFLSESGISYLFFIKTIRRAKAKMLMPTAILCIVPYHILWT